MPTVARQLKKVYFDANFSEYVAEAFHQLEISDNEIEVISTKSAFGEDASDLDIIAKHATNGGILFTMDSDFKKVPIISEMIGKNNVGVILYKQHNLPYWDLVRMLINYWADVRKIVIRHEMPFICKVTHKKGKSTHEFYDFKK